MFQSYAEYGVVSCLLIESLRATFARSRTQSVCSIAPVEKGEAPDLTKSAKKENRVHVEK